MFVPVVLSVVLFGSATASFAGSGAVVVTSEGFRPAYPDGGVRGDQREVPDGHDGWLKVEGDAYGGYRAVGTRAMSCKSNASESAQRERRPR